jgi:hypothetical protein
MTDYKQPCAELCDDLEEWVDGYLINDPPDDHTVASQARINRVRALLAQPEPAGEVSDEEFRDLADFDHNFDRYDTTNDQGENGVAWECTDANLIAFARAAIALDRSRRAPVQAADGEVAELVAWLRDLGAKKGGCFDVSTFCANLDRAATLLQHHQPPQPVPVSERLPGPEDCDAEGRCWLCGKVEGDWRLLNPKKSGVPQLKYCFSHWLPAHAIPIPRSENV